MDFEDYEPSFENAHPNAKALMSDDFFYDVLSETAPFGSDDGSDTYAGFKDWRKDNKNESPVTFLEEQIDNWDYPEFDLTETNIENLKPYFNQSELGERFMIGIDAAIVATAFGQLYLEGKIDSDIKILATTSVKRELLPEILNSWGENAQERENNLMKLLAVLDKVK